MDRIEKGLHQHHASLQATEANKPETPTAPQISPATPASDVPETPFARINTVENGSPANEAGLKAGDKIRTFGAANWTNHEHLRKVGEVVQRNEGRPILVKIVRGEPAQEMQLRVTPRKNWGGRGTLGCHILPI